MYFGTIDYVKELLRRKEDGKAMAFWMYAYNMEFDRDMPLNGYAALWRISTNECEHWIDEFSNAISDSVAIKRVMHKKHSKAMK